MPIKPPNSTPKGNPYDFSRLPPSEIPERSPQSMAPKRQGTLEGKRVVVVFNGNAQDGAIAHEYEELERLLTEQGAVVQEVRTVKDKAERRGKIFGEMTSLLYQVSPRPKVTFPVHQELPPILLMPYGGDGIVCEAMRQTVMAAGISRHYDQDAQFIADRLSSQVALFLVDKGKAADNAKQVDAPAKIRRIPSFAKRAVELPFWYSIIETMEEKLVKQKDKSEKLERIPHFEVAGHSYSRGVGALLFKFREENLAKNPNSYWNKGIKSYVRVLPRAMFHPLGLKGFNAQVKHYDKQGTLKQEASALASEFMVTPNRLIAKFGGVPGSWGETKVIILPPGEAGALSLGEYVFRGVATKLGWNQVSPRHSMKTLSADREFRLLPGEWMEVEIAPDVPAQLNGDVEEPHPKFTIHAPDYSLNELADPHSLGVILARDSALLQGKSPLISDQELVAHIIPEEAPKILQNDERVRHVRTPFLSLKRLDPALRQRNFTSPKSIADLLLATQHVETPVDFVRMANRDLTVEKVQDYLDSASKQPLGENFGERLLMQGVPLAGGVAAMFASERLADHLGWDRDVDREFRFALMMYAGHAAQANLAPLWEVAANRLMNRPYDFVRVRQVRVASEMLAQWTYSRHVVMEGAMGASWWTGALGLEAGLEQGLLRKGARVLMLPVTGAWNMGHGLIFSRMAEGLVETLDAPKMVKDYTTLAAFFIPDAGSILFPRATAGLLRFSGMELGARVFAAGFIADMALATWQHGQFGTKVRQEREVNQIAGELRRRSGRDGPINWRQALRFISPTLADHIDSHEYGFGTPNVFHRMAEKIQT